MKRAIVTSGCSFTDTGSVPGLTWPLHLENYLRTKYPERNDLFVNIGKASQGNGLISRKTIYAVSKLLENGYQPENIIVGVMWSGPNRHDFYIGQGHHFSKDPLYYTGIGDIGPDLDGSIGYNLTSSGPEQVYNASNVIFKSGKSWQIINPWFVNEESKAYYGTFGIAFSGYIYSLEHILRTQWFLKVHGIKNFMTTFTSEVLPVGFIKSNQDTAHLYKQLDLDVFLPIEGEYEWCRDHSGFDFPKKDDPHPGKEQHQAFTERVIIPWLIDKEMI
jgi:hypothetical protein